MAYAARPPTTTKTTAVMPSTKNATSRMTKAGVETGEKMLGVDTRSAASATAGRPSAINPAEAARIDTRELYRVWPKNCHRANTEDSPHVWRRL